MMRPESSIAGEPLAPAGAGQPPVFSVLGVKAHAIKMTAAVRAFDHAIGNNLKVYAHALGVAGVMEGWRNPRLRMILNRSYLNTPDGMPLVWLARYFGHRDTERVYGPDLLREVCRYSLRKGWRHFFFGASPGVAPLLRERVEVQFPGIQVVGTYTPPFRTMTDLELAELIRLVDDAQPDIFWISLSTPHQLYFMFDQFEHIHAKVMCAVGFAFDVNAGLKKDAPAWIKQMGLQWLHRLVRDPRLWRRYLRDNPLFLGLIALQLLRLRRYALSPDAQVPITSASDKAELLSSLTRADSRSLPSTERVNVLGIGIDPVNMTSAVEELISAACAGRKGYVCVTGVHGVMESQQDEQLRQIHNRSLLTVPDGMPLVWEGRWRGFSKMRRVYGPDLMLNILERTARQNHAQRTYSAPTPRLPLRHFFCGATPDILQRLVVNLQRRFPGLCVVGCYAPPFRPLNADEEADLARQVAACQPDFFWVGLSTPKQERFMAHYLPLLDVKIMLGVGAAFDLHAGLRADAPGWAKKTGLQWLHRLLQEPRRLWRRYLWIVPTFLWRIVLQHFGLMKYSLDGRGAAGRRENINRKGTG